MIRDSGLLFRATL